jgi:hypothetical protein
MNYTIKIVDDYNAENPCQDWDMLTQFVTFSRRFDFGNCKDFKNVEEFKAFMKRNRAGFFYPLYMYSHSGETISLTPFSCPWDSGQIGWVFVTKTNAVKEFGKKVTKEQIDNIVKAEVETMDCYIRGDVYGFEILDENEEVVDTCYGYYGRENVEQAAKESLEYFENKVTA